MPRDYARNVSKQKRPLVERGWRKRLLFAGFLLLLVSSVAYGIYVYEQHKANDSSQSIALWIKKVKALFVKAPNNQKQTIDSSGDVLVKQDTEIQFSFYTDLATMQVSAPQPPPAQTVVEKKPTEVASLNQVVPTTTPPKEVPEKYLLQIAAFKNPTAAGEMRISLLLEGFEAEIVKAMHNDQQLYQLQQGPFSTIAEAKSMQRELKKKDIQSVIVKKIT